MQQNTSSADMEWNAIVGLTYNIVQRVHKEDSGALLAQLDVRNQKIRQYFFQIDQHSERLTDIQQRVADLLALDEHIICSCRALQSEAMAQLSTARRAKLGIKVYTASQYQAF